MDYSKQDTELPIGVFDSGVGGLTVLRELLRLLPQESFRYLGDTARLPYGTKSQESVVRYALQSSKHLVNRGIKLLVVACNTASSVALPALADAYPHIPVIGVVLPGARAACRINTNGRMAVIGTEATVRGGAYQNAVLNICPHMLVEAESCSLFVALAEEGWVSGKLVEAVIARSLKPLFTRFNAVPPDCLVLGCTHFPVLGQAIQRVVGSHVTVIDSAETTALEVRDILTEQKLFTRAKVKQIELLATDGVERFARVGSIFLGRTVMPNEVELVDL